MTKEKQFVSRFSTTTSRYIHLLLYTYNSRFHTLLSPLAQTLLSAILAYSSSYLCRMIHCGQCNLSPDVLVGRMEETPLINKGERKQHNEDKKGTPLCPWPGGKTNLYCTQLIFSEIHGKCGPTLHCVFCFFVKCTVLISIALPVKLFGFFCIVCLATQ